MMRCSSCQRSPGAGALVELLELRPGRLELRRGAVVVDLLHVDGIVDERERPIELDLEEPGAGGELEHLVAAEVHPRRAGLQRRDERRVAGEDADLAGLAGDDQHLCLAVVGGAVRRDDRDVELRVRVGHGALRGDPLELLRLLDGLLDRPDHVEGRLGQVVVRRRR